MPIGASARSPPTLLMLGALNPCSISRTWSNTRRDAPYCARRAPLERETSSFTESRMLRFPRIRVRRSLASRAGRTSARTRRAGWFSIGSGVVGTSTRCVHVGAAVADVAGADIAGSLGADFNRRQDRVAANLAGDDLIERGPGEKSSASVRFGAVPVSQVPVLTACVPASGRSRLETTVTRSRNVSIGLRIGLNSKPAPVVVGVQWLGRSPIGTNTAPKRRVGVAAVWPSASAPAPWHRAAAAPGWHRCHAAPFDGTTTSS